MSKRNSFKLGSEKTKEVIKEMSVEKNEEKDEVDPIELEMNNILSKVASKDPNQKEFLQSVEEMFETLKPLIKQNKKYLNVLLSLCEPERVIQFKVPWINDKGQLIINRGFRVQFNQSIGPYKGGLRFHKSVNLSIIKFLGFEQIFKNALTGLPLGGGKGGSDFNPKGKSNAEILKFCQSFMTELHKYIGPNCDVPAGDIGVGGREIGFLYGQYKRITAQSVGVLTGKGIGWGGSKIRPEATGYGILYITDYALKDLKDTIKDKNIALSGSGNVALFACQKALELGGKVISLSDSSGSLVKLTGFTKEDYKELVTIKTIKRGRIKDFLKTYKEKDVKYYEKERPWKYIKGVDIVIPCATQNEINLNDAKCIINNGCKYLIEGSNMPTENDAITFLKPKVKLFIPAKAANAGGVAVSGLEMAQNGQKEFWSSEKVDARLKEIMQNIYNNSKKMAKDLGNETDIQLGANCAGFKTVAKAMFDQGFAL